MSDGRSGSKTARVQFDPQTPSEDGGTEPMTTNPTAPGAGAANFACAKYGRTISTMSDGRSGSKTARVQFDPQTPSEDGGTEPMTNQPTAPGAGAANVPGSLRQANLNWD